MIMNAAQPQLVPKRRVVPTTMTRPDATGELAEAHELGGGFHPSYIGIYQDYIGITWDYIGII